jgi:hypothetical protein
MSADWTALGALATVATMFVFIATGLVVWYQLRAQRADQFVQGTATIFAIWMDDDFQRAQQWILYELKEQTWKDYVAAHRNDYGERAIIRVGSYYNRIGYLVTYHLLGNNDRILLDTVAGLAIAVWQKIAPLVLEARLVENSTLFQDYERMLPRCYECYVPTQPVLPIIAARVHEEQEAEGALEAVRASR